jgi:hypothetical protein
MHVMFCLNLHFKFREISVDHPLNQQSIISTFTWRYAVKCLFFFTLDVSLFSNSRWAPWSESYHREWLTGYYPTTSTSPLYVLSPSLLTCRISWSSTPSFQHFKAALSLSLSKFSSSQRFSFLFPSLTSCIFTYEMRVGRWDFLCTLWLHGSFNVCSTHNKFVYAVWQLNM